MNSYSFHFKPGEGHHLAAARLLVRRPETPPRPARGISARRVLISTILFLLVSSATASAEEATKRVLVVTSYDMNLPGVVSFHQAMRASMREGSKARVEFFYEFQENTRLPIDKYEEYIVSYLQHKYEGEHFDLVIALGGPALNLLLKHEAVLFTDTPKLFYFFEEPEETLRGVWPHATGVWSRLDVSQTLDVALTLHPETRRVFVINSGAADSDPMREQAQVQLRKYEGKLEFVYLDDLTMDELRGKVAALPKNSLVLYLGFAKDSAGNTYTGPEALSMFAPASSAPVYGVSETYLGAGIVGGSLIDFAAIGRRTGEMGLRILSGAKPADIAPETVPNVAAFDWRELRRWGISEDRLPPGSVVRFKEPSFWDHYRWRIIGVISLCLVESFLIFALLAQRARRSRAEEGLRVSVHRLGERVKELTALHHTARVLQDESKSVPELLQEIVELLPPAWQYPEVTAGRITLGEMEFKTPNFSRSPFTQSAEFQAGGLRGAIEVCYLEERPEADFGPFLVEEKNLIDSLAEMIQTALDRRFTQDQLRASEERFTKAFQASPVPIAIINDSKRTFLEVNESWETAFGYSREETIGRTALELNFLTAEDRDRLRAIGERQNFLRDEEVNVRTKQGELRHVTMSTERFLINGELCNIFLFSDITERKRAEDALRESERRFSDMLTNIEMVAVMADLNGDITFCNDYLLRLTGWQREEAIGRNWYEMFLPEDEKKRVSEILGEAELTGDVTVHMENEIKTRSGARRLMRWTNTPLRRPDGKVIGLAALGDDITERKEAEEQLKTSSRQLRALSESLRKAKEDEGIRIARELHDELGAALTSLKWSLTRLNGAGTEGADTNGDGSTKIEEMVSLIDATINTVRRISSELRPGVLDDLGLIPAIEWHAQQVQANTGIVCRFESQVENVGLSRERATTVFRIFQEAMTNVLRHAGATRVNILVEEEDDEFVLDVSDNGRGITDSEKLGTRSLGLLGMRERAHSVGGRVEIKGTPGKGTTLIVRVPLTS
ncbi:MAG: PAS domain S-box protein [Acidobacteria bacterium]|nr:PAS domain S-box protein [Acidobacteriota bacterium]